MLDNMIKYNLIPEEIFSERNIMAYYGTLDKILFYDIFRQLWVSADISSVESENSYNRIDHAIASLVIQAFGVLEEDIEAVLTSIEEVKYFLRTAYRDFKEYVCSAIEVKFQGICQGNRAAPAGWAVISITKLLFPIRGRDIGATSSVQYPEVKVTRMQFYSWMI